MIPRMGRNDSVKDRNKRYRSYFKYSDSTRFRPSCKSDNYRFCARSHRNKYCYETLQKAAKALEYHPECIRAYWCKCCCAYHLTSKTKEEYWDEHDKMSIKRYGVLSLRATLDRNGENA